MIAFGSFLAFGVALLAPAPPGGIGVGGRGFHPNYTPHWGCFGYCNGPLRPDRHYTCFGYCPGPVVPHWGCYGYCPGPLYPSYPYWGPSVIPVPEYVPSNPTVIYQGNINAQVNPPTPSATSSGDAAAVDPNDTKTFAFKSGVDQWIEQLSSPSAKKRGEAVEALANFGPKATKAVDYLVPMLADRDPQLRVEVTLTLAKLGKVALPGLIQGLSSGDRLVQMGCCLSLGHMAKGAAEAVPALKSLLKSSDAAVRGHAAQALWRIDKSTKDVAIPALVAGLSDENRAVRMGALTTLSQMGAAAEPAIPGLTKLLEDKDAQIRIAAAVALSNIAPSNTSTLPALLAGLNDASEYVRRDAAAALAHMSLSGLDAGVALAPLAKALRDDDATVAHHAAVALGHLGAPAVKPLTDALSDPKTSVRRYAILGLEQLGKAAAPALPKLKELAKSDNDDEVKFMAEEAAQCIAAAK